MFGLKLPLKLRTTITLLVLLVVAMVLLVVHLFYLRQITEQTRFSLEEKAKAVSHTLVASPDVARMLLSPWQQTPLQNYIEQVRRQNNLLFVVIMDMQGIRHTHPNQSLLGQHFAGGDETRALNGMETIGEAQGTLGYSLRVITPLYHRGQQIGAIAVGISTQKLDELIEKNRLFTYIAVLFGAFIGTIGAFMLARQIKRIMFGLEPIEIADLFEQRNAMLHCIREGVLAVNVQAEVTLINDEAKSLFRRMMTTEAMLANEGSRTWPMLFNLQHVLQTGESRYDEEIIMNGITLLANCIPLRINGQITGAIVTFRDKTEVSQLIQRITGMSHYADALRGQTHEFMNKLHVILGLVSLRAYDQLENYIMDIADRYHADIGSLVRQIHDPVMAGFLLSKVNHAKEQGVEIDILTDPCLPESNNAHTAHELITIVGNLLENALDAMHGQIDGLIVLHFTWADDALLLEVSNNGPLIAADVAQKIFEQGFSTKGIHRGMGLYLVKQSVENMQGTIACTSTLETGTCFTARLPYVAKEKVND